MSRTFNSRTATSDATGQAECIRCGNNENVVGKERSFLHNNKSFPYKTYECTPGTGCQDFAITKPTQDEELEADKLGLDANKYQEARGYASHRNILDAVKQGMTLDDYISDHKLLNDRGSKDTKINHEAILDIDKMNAKASPGYRKQRARRHQEQKGSSPRWSVLNHESVKPFLDPMKPTPSRQPATRVDYDSVLEDLAEEFSKDKNSYPIDVREARVLPQFKRIVIANGKTPIRQSDDAYSRDDSAYDDPDAFLPERENFENQPIEGLSSEDSIDNRITCPTCHGLSEYNSPDKPLYKSDHCKSCETQNCGSDHENPYAHCRGCRFAKNEEAPCEGRQKAFWNPDEKAEGPATCPTCANVGSISVEKEHCDTCQSHTCFGPVDPTSIHCKGCEEQGDADTPEDRTIGRHARHPETAVGSINPSAVKEGEETISLEPRKRGEANDFQSFDLSSGLSSEDINDDVSSAIKTMGPTRALQEISQTGALPGVDKLSDEERSTLMQKLPGQVEESIKEKPIRAAQDVVFDSPEAIARAEALKEEDIKSTDQDTGPIPTIVSHPNAIRLEQHGPGCKCGGRGTIDHIPEERKKINNSDEFNEGIAKLNTIPGRESRLKAIAEFTADQYKCRG